MMPSVGFPIRPMPKVQMLQPKQTRFGADEAPKPESKGKPFYPREVLPEKISEVAKLLSNLAFMRTQDYRDEVKKSYESAKTILKDFIKQGGDPTKAAVVMDIDETVLDNSSNYLKRLTEKLPGRLSYFNWMKTSNAPAIPEALDLIKFALSKKFNLFFTTGRKEGHRDATILNLKRVGIPESKYTLYLKPKDYKEDSMNNYKVQAQQDIQAKGLKIALVIGDQDSDIQGALGPAVKVPTNYLYNVD